MQGYLIDTNIFIHNLNGQIQAIRFLESLALKNAPTTTSVITECELLSFSSLSHQDRKIINMLLSSYNILGIDSSIAQCAARLRRHHKLSTPDAFIAATSIIHQYCLVSCDRDFVSIPGLLVEVLHV